MNNHDIIITGITGSGKDYLRARLEQHGYVHWKNRTTRPKRVNEQSTHTFVDSINPDRCAVYSSYTLADGTFVEYGLDIIDFLNLDIGKSTVVIAAQAEVAALREYMNNPVVVHLTVPKETVMYRLIKRGDDMDEIVRRISSDLADIAAHFNEDVTYFPDADSALEYLIAEHE